MGFVLVYLLVLVVVGGGVGYLIGANKGLGSAGFWLGALLGLIGWIIVAVMEPSEEERIRRQQQFVIAMQGGVVVVQGDRPCPHCAELIKPAAIVCRFCGRDVEPLPAATSTTLAPPVPGAPASRDRADYDDLKRAFPGVFDAVWSEATAIPVWPTDPRPAFTQACRKVLAGGEAKKATRRALATNLPADGGNAW